MSKSLLCTEGAFHFSFVCVMYQNTASSLSGKQITSKLWKWMIFNGIHLNQLGLPECPTITLNHTSWIVVPSLTVCPLSVRNCCLIEVFVGITCVVILLLAHLSRLEWAIVVARRLSSVRRKLLIFSTSSPEPLAGFWWNLVGMKYSLALRGVVVVNQICDRGFMTEQT